VTVSVSVTVSVFSILWPSCVLHKKKIRKTEKAKRNRRKTNKRSGKIKPKMLAEVTKCTEKP